MKNYAEGPEMPMGLGMALAQDINAMNRFASLSKDEQQRLIDHTHSIQSKQEMKAFVQQLGSGSATF